MIVMGVVECGTKMEMDTPQDAGILNDAWELNVKSATGERAQIIPYASLSI
jgi:hypothetical protein